MDITKNIYAAITAGGAAALTGAVLEAIFPSTGSVDSTSALKSLLEILAQCTIGLIASFASIDMLARRGLVSGTNDLAVSVVYTLVFTASQPTLLNKIAAYNSWASKFLQNVSLTSSSQKVAKPGSTNTNFTANMYADTMSQQEADSLGCMKDGD